MKTNVVMMNESALTRNNQEWLYVQPMATINYNHQANNSICDSFASFRSGKLSFMLLNEWMSEWASEWIPRRLSFACKFYSRAIHHCVEWLIPMINWNQGRAPSSFACTPACTHRPDHLARPIADWSHLYGQHRLCCITIDRHLYRYISSALSGILWMNQPHLHTRY